MTLTPLGIPESEVCRIGMMPDHVHMMLSIPPKFAVSQVVGFIKGKGPRQRPLLPPRAAPILKPPALPGDIYLGN